MSEWTGFRDHERAAPAPQREGIELSEHLFYVLYADEEPHVFSDGTNKRFGRDDLVCEIPIWEQICGQALSRVAGELWCTGGQMWVRNLSTAHELVISGGAGAHVLPPRVGDEPGAACSVPRPRGRVMSPSTGSWALIVMTVVEPGVREDMDAADAEAATLRLDNIPEKHRDVAEALCAPLLAGKGSPATYAQIAARCGCTDRVARRRVEALSLHYKSQVEALPGGRRAGETLTESVARALVARDKFSVPTGIAPAGEQSS